MTTHRCSGEMALARGIGPRAAAPLLLLAAAALLAPPPAAARLRPDRAELAAEVRVVNVPVLVTDWRGRPVHDLARWDFTLWVDGVETPVDYLTEVRDGQAVPSSLAQLAAPRPVVGAGPVATNFLIFVDPSFAVGGRLAAALSRLRADLPRLQPQDSMAIVAAAGGGQLDLLNGWSRDPAVLAAAMDRAARLPAAGLPALALDPSDRLQETGKLRTAAATAATALRGLPAPPGRNVMVLLAAGWAMTLDGGAYEPLIEAANQLDYTLFAVDVGTLDPWSVSQLQEMTRETGGRATQAARASLLGLVADDTACYYWLGFTAHASGDARGHHLRLEVAHRGATVHARKEYLDEDPVADAAAAAKVEGLPLRNAGAGGPQPDEAPAQSSQ